MRSRAWDGIRGRNIALIPQDASLALNPVYKVGAQMTEALTQHISMSKHDARRRVLTTLERAGLGDSGRVFEAYPHELSGGMKQRVAIALALLCDPAVIIADDPTSAVDVTIQAQILKEFGDLVSRTNVSLIFISHDLRVVTSVCDVVAVLYAGQLNELGPAEQIRDSVHPYTRALVRCAPTVERRVEPLPTIPGGGGANPCTLSGCRFNARCSRAEARCKETMPGLTAAGEGHLRACWNPFD